MNKYIVCPGYVFYEERPNQFGVYFIDTHSVTSAYNIDYGKCIILNTLDDLFGLSRNEEYLFLTPKKDGSYTLPEKPIKINSIFDTLFEVLRFNDVFKGKINSYQDKLEELNEKST